MFQPDEPTPFRRASASHSRRLAWICAAACLIGGLMRPTDVRADDADDFNASLSLYKSKRYELAADGFTEFLAKYETSSQRPLAQLYLGQALMHQRKFSEARDVFSKFAAGNSKHADLPLALYRVGEASFFLDDPKAARASFEDFLERFPNHELGVWTWHYLGESRLQLGDATGAVEAFSQVIEKFPNSSLVVESKFSRARAYQQLKEIDKAAEAFRELSSDDQSPRAADALFSLATLQFDNARYADAVQSFNNFTSRHAEDRRRPMADLNAGYAHYYLREFDQAVESFNKAQTSPDHEVLAVLWAGIARKADGRYEEAVAILKPAYEKFSATSDADELLFHWADSEFRANQLTAAIPLFVQVADRFPTSEHADRSLYFAIEGALKVGDLDEASRLHKRFREGYLKSGLVMLEELLYGRVLLTRAERLSPSRPLSEEAAKEARSAAQHFSDVLQSSKVERTTDWARLFLGRAQQMLGEHQKVLETLKPLNERLANQAIPSEFAESLFLTGRSAAQLKDWVGADAAFETFLSLKPSTADAAAAAPHLAVIKVQAGKESELDALWAQMATLGVAPKPQADAIHAAAELCFERKQWADSLKLFTRLSELPAETHFRAIGYSGAGHAAFQLNDYAAAATAFRKLLDEAPGEDPKLTADAAFLLGMSLDSAGQKPEAGKAYQEGALRLAGQDGKITSAPADLEQGWHAYRCARGAARVFAELKEIDQSDAAYEDAWLLLQAQSSDRKQEADKLLNEWALVNYNAERFDRSDELFRRLSDDFPASNYADDARHYLAESLLQDGKYVEARKAFSELLANTGSDDFVQQASLVNLVELAARSEDWKGVDEFAKTLLERFPDSNRKLAAQYRRGEAALQLNDLETAKTMLGGLRDTILAAPAGTPLTFEWSEGVWLLLAEVEQQAKNYPQVESLVTEFHTRFPESKVGYQADEVLGRSFVQRLEFEKAREVFQNVVDSPEGAKTPTAARAQTGIADTFLYQKDDKAAAREFFKVASNYDIPELQAAALLNAGKCQVAMKSPEEAARTYQELIEKFPDSQYAEQARTELKAIGKTAP